MALKPVKPVSRSVHLHAQFTHTFRSQTVAFFPETDGPTNKQGPPSHNTTKKKRASTRTKHTHTHYKGPCIMWPTTVAGWSPLSRPKSAAYVCALASPSGTPISSGPTGTETGFGRLWAKRLASPGDRLSRQNIWANRFFLTAQIAGDDDIAVT